MEWRQHPSLPLEANAEGDVRYKGRVKPQRFDTDGYKMVSFGPRHDAHTVKVHRVVLACFEGESPLQVDHLDRNRSNNVLSNLRYATPSQNSRNIVVKPVSASQIRCVRWRKDRKCWQAYRTDRSKFISVGHFSTIEAAKQAAEAHYGTP